MTNARELTTRLAELLRREHVAMADFLVALADFDQRKLWAELGHSSLFYFLHRELGLSAGAAHYRKVAAGLVQRFPELVEPLRDGKLCITSVVELAKVLTPENRLEVLPRFFHRSKREAMAVAAELRPAETPPRRELVTLVRATPSAVRPGPFDSAASGGSAQGMLREAAPPVRPERSAAAGGAESKGERSRRASIAPPEPAASTCSFQPVETVHANSSPAEPPSPPGTAPACERRDETRPLTADLSRLHVTVSRRFLEKLEAARAALSHARPGASAEEILEAGLDLVLAQHANRRGLVNKPRREPPPSKPDHVPAHVKREVWKRDAGKCQWRLDSGGICGSTLPVELDHVALRCRGGPPTVANLRCLCKFHNDRAARAALGDAWMDRFTRGGRVSEPCAPNGSPPVGGVTRRAPPSRPAEQGLPSTSARARGMSLIELS